MNPLRWSFRSAFLLGLVLCAALLGYAWYAELELGLAPCYLCWLQRGAFIWMGVFFLIGGLHAPAGGGRWAYVGLVLAGCVFGIAIAIRQLWLQSLPAGQAPQCGASLGMLVAQFRGHFIPLSEFLTTVLRGSSDCALVTWKFLGLSMAGWTLIWYVLLGLWALLPRPHRNKLSQVRPFRAARS